MEPRLTTREREHLLVEIESLVSWYAEIESYLKDGLQDVEISRDDFGAAVVQASRLLLRMKSMCDRINDGSEEEAES